MARNIVIVGRKCGKPEGFSKDVGNASLKRLFNSAFSTSVIYARNELWYYPSPNPTDIFTWDTTDIFTWE